MPKLTVIMPCYYNEGNIPITGPQLIENEKLFPADVEFEYIFVDDGSKDNTLEELVKFQKQYPEKVKVVKLAGNVGSYNAILAGMKYSTGDCNVMLAADLQDPPELIPEMYDHWLKGVKFVIANRKDRDEPLSQKLFSNTFHFLIKQFALPNVPSGGFDLVLFDRTLCKLAVEINEKNTNQIYLLAWMDFAYVSIPYVRRKRDVGKSRWTLKKKVKLLIDTFVSFSFFPIRAISVMGLLLGFVAFLYGIFIVYAKLAGWVNVSGWSSMMIVILMVGSFQMIALGIIGEYVWRALDAARHRPNYIVDSVFDSTKQ